MLILLTDDERKKISFRRTKSSRYPRKILLRIPVKLDIKLSNPVKAITAEPYCREAGQVIGALRQKYTALGYKQNDNATKAKQIH